MPIPLLRVSPGCSVQFLPPACATRASSFKCLCDILSLPLYACSISLWAIEFRGPSCASSVSIHYFGLLGDCVPPTPRRCCAAPCHGSQLPPVRHYPCCHGPQLPPVRHYPRLRRPLQPSSSSFLSKLLLLSFPCSSSVSSKICQPSSTRPPCFILSASLLLRDVDCCIPSVYFPPLWFLYFFPLFLLCLHFQCCW